MNDFLKIVMPVYNEMEIIGSVIEDWDKTLSGMDIHFEIHCYNDGSKDKTLSTLESLRSRFPRLVIHDKPNSGHGPTILQGYQEASLDPHTQWIFQVDSDNELRASEFHKLWSRRNEFDLLIGIRDQRESPVPRQLITSISRRTVWIFYGKSVKDVNCPYRLMRVSAFRDLFKKIPSDTFAPNVILSGLASRHSLRVLNVPVTHHNRQTGEVSIKKWKLLKVALRSFRQTISFAMR